MTTPVKYKTLNIENGCMVNSVAFKDVFKAKKALKKHRAKILYVDVTKTDGHAVCVFAEGDEWFVYDMRHGTFSIGTFKRAPRPEQVMKAMQLQEEPDSKLSKPHWY